VIPRVHVPDLWKADDELAADLMRTVIRLGRAIQSAVQPEGLNLITSAGPAAEQTVFHLHLHIVPRWRRDGFGPLWPVGRAFEDVELADAVSRIRAACRELND
jgi:histidine triad (HIT) family protein